MVTKKHILQLVGGHQETCSLTGGHQEPLSLTTSKQDHVAVPFSTTRKYRLHGFPGVPSSDDLMDTTLCVIWQKDRARGSRPLLLAEDLGTVLMNVSAVRSKQSSLCLKAATKL